MAFTLAHMAAALPFYRCQKWLNVEALFIGTMLPDLPYFLNSNPMVAQHSHQWIGLLTYCLPLGLAVFALWYWLLKSALIALIQPWQRVQGSTGHNHHSMQAALPQYPFGLWFAARMQKYGVFWLKVVLGLLLGSITHLLWDGTTHPDGFIAIRLGLQYPVSIAYLGDIPMARFLQYVTSIFALILLIGFTWNRWQVSVAISKIQAANIHRGSLHTAQTQSNNAAKYEPKKHFSKGQSGVILLLLCLCCLVWGLYNALRWHKLLSNDNYLYLAKILVGALQGAGTFFCLYALLYWGVAVLLAQTVSQRPK